MRLDSTVRPAAQVITKSVGDELVLLDFERGIYYGLNEVGARIWQLLGEGLTLAAIVTTLADEYDAPPEELELDLLRLVGELVEKELVAISQ